MKLARVKFLSWLTFYLIGNWESMFSEHLLVLQLNHASHLSLTRLCLLALLITLWETLYFMFIKAVFETSNSIFKTRDQR